MVSNLLLGIQEVNEAIHLKEEVVVLGDFGSGWARCHVICSAIRY